MTILDTILLAATVIAGIGALVLTKWLTKMRRAEWASRRNAHAAPQHSDASQDRAAPAIKEMKALAESLPLAASVSDTPSTKARAPQKWVSGKNVWANLQGVLEGSKTAAARASASASASERRATRSAISANYYIIQKAEKDAVAMVDLISRQPEDLKAGAAGLRQVQGYLDVTAFNRSGLH